MLWSGWGLSTFRLIDQRQVCLGVNRSEFASRFRYPAAWKTCFMSLMSQRLVSTLRMWLDFFLLFEIWRDPWCMLNMTGWQLQRQIMPLI
jgi:hypothetical protein